MRPVLLVVAVVLAGSAFVGMVIVSKQADAPAASAKAVGKGHATDPVAASPAKVEDGAMRDVVKSWLTLNVHDTDGLEYVEWGDTYRVKIRESFGVYKDAIVLGLKFRARNAVGAKTIHDEDFLILDGKVADRKAASHDGFKHHDIACRWQSDGALRYGVLKGPISADWSQLPVIKESDFLMVDTRPFGLQIDGKSHAQLNLANNQFEFTAVTPGDFSLTVEPPPVYVFNPDIITLFGGIQPMRIPVRFDPGSSGVQTFSVEMKIKK